MIYKKCRRSITLAVLCCLLLTACGAKDSAATTQQPQTSQAEQKTSTQGDRLLDEATAVGDVLSVGEDSLTLLSAETSADGTLMKQAASGTEDASAGSTVYYDANCQFENAVIDTSTGAVSSSAAVAGDVKRDASVAVYGDIQDDGSILATRVVLLHYITGGE